MILTVDLGFGDAGKGSIVDYLTRTHSAHTVVRYNGGAQAGHRVVAPDGRAHVFAQFGAGTLAGAATFLSRHMLLEPLAMLEEERHLTRLGLPDALANVTLDQQALLITPFARALNRLRELARGTQRHGSCGIGIGETVDLALHYPDHAPRAGDLRHPAILSRKLTFLRERAYERLAALRPTLPASPDAAAELDLLHDPDLIPWLLDAYDGFARRVNLVGPEYVCQLLQRDGTIIFEGAQGVLLDEWRGFHPHTTWSTTTLAYADQLLAEAGFTGQTQRIGITRAYATRHGAGPLVSEEPALTAAMPDPANHDHPWQSNFRVGWLDLVQLRYARAVVGPLDHLAVTCLDRLAALPELRICTRYSFSDAAAGTSGLGGNFRGGLGPPRTPLLQLPIVHPPDLNHQAQLTATLMHCTAHTEPLHDAQHLLARLSQTLDLPVTITSWGPSATDKREIEARM
ncbi:MAG: adenylosuccinate synthetase [Candidatus Viridilinea halotolerans]|uniref:Adenylosuccinate synthetase n=1 Tax=Candidatus Viridilinea halotolerans TaxID=2491704 RepID=A0A426U3A4_9CHLR|nr:MAG: adenylosuccinate synthetase [Candidatus Viridilinea halotolerans]